MSIEGVKRKARPALTPGLRKLFYALAAGIALLGANSVYLGGISLLGFLRDANFENQFYLFMFLFHLALGLLLTLPFLAFAAFHMRNTWRRRNRKAVNLGHGLFAACVGVILTGIVMTVRVVPLDSLGGRLSYWLHVLLPVVAIFAYVAHRLYGPRIKWKWGICYGVSVALVSGGMVAFHGQDPRLWNVRGGGEAYFYPSESRTSTLGFIPRESLMMDRYCQECHPDAFDQHYQSVHHLSSFNNPPYLFSVRETRAELMKRDGNVQGARFCAGCHDPVPFFSGAFDDPNFDDVNDPTANEGITCTVCHAIVDVHGTIGNGNYTIEEPLHYPFAYSDNPFLKWVNHQLVKAKPAFHKKTFLKPLHKTGEFCATCHKVSLPYELNHYKEWLRGQNHWDNFLLSGVSGNGSRSFYYPDLAEPNCNECHMPRIASEDFGAVEGKIHDHRFPGSNTAIPFMKGLFDQQKLQSDFLKDGQVSVDIFALRKGGTITGDLIAPLGDVPVMLEAGKSYLLEVVVRTQKVGHVFTQGTSDSNQLWLEVSMAANGQEFARSGQTDENGFVDPWSHFLNSYVLDRRGKRVDRRNAQDIFVPLYSNQQPPGTGQVVHYRFTAPKDLAGRVTAKVKLRYRKFDQTYMGHVYNDLAARGLHDGPVPQMPVTTMAESEVVLNVTAAAAGTPSAKPTWQRWRDYGIGLFRKGNSGASKGELRQASEAFHEVVGLGRSEGWLDLARVFEKEGRIEDARAALAKAVAAGTKTPWVVNWLTGLIDRQNGYLDRAISSFEKVLATRIPKRGFDFSRDYQVQNELGRTLLLRARKARDKAERRGYYLRAVETFSKVLALDSENLSAHFNLMQCHRALGNREQAEVHRKLHAKYKPDDNARDQAVQLHRSKNPAADHAANAIVIYDLKL
ncbi:MAG: multiheme c-type cytochrome [Planctomycetota bacterium]